MTKPSHPIPGVGVVILRDGVTEPEVVLIQRGKAPRLGQWSIPGGKQELGETVEAAGIREALEETGLQIEITGLLEVIDFIDTEASVHYTLIDFAAKPVGGTLRAGSDAAAAEWIPISDAIDRVDWSETKRILRLAADRHLV